VSEPLHLRPLGYLYKRIAGRPAWLEATDVVDVYSLSSCISEPFADYIPFWKHNGFWLFDSPAIIRELAAEHGLALDGLRLFYYEAHEREYDEVRRTWLPYAPEASFRTAIAPPRGPVLEGFDVTSFTAGTAPECSPLSCNAAARGIATNAHCLFATAAEAVHALERGGFADAEPGPYRVIAVHSVDDPGAE